MARNPLPQTRALRFATLAGSFPAFDPEEAIPTLEVPAAARTEEILLDDILEEVRLVPMPTWSAAPRIAQSRRPIASGMGPWIAGGVAMGVLVCLGAAIAARVVASETPYARTTIVVVEGAHEAAVIATTPASPSTPPPLRGTIPNVALDALPLAPSIHGTLAFSARSNGHRVFVDGVVLGDSSAPFEVPCGKHAIKVGGRGELQNVDVPCGGIVTLK